MVLPSPKPGVFVVSRVVLLLFSRCRDRLCGVVGRRLVGTARAAPPPGQVSIVKLSAKQRLTLKIAGLGVAVLMLQIAFSLFYWLPNRSLRIALQPSVDVIALIGIILIGTNLGRLRGLDRKVLLSLVPIVLGACVLLGIAQGVALREFGYHFTLAYHTSKVQALFKMMYEAQSWPVFTISMVLLALAIALLVACAAWALSRLIAEGHKGRRQRITIASCVAGYAVVGGFVLGINGSMTVELASQVDEVIHREERLHARAKKIEKTMTKVKRLKIGDNLRRPTVLVFVVESYGQVLMEAEKYADFRSFLGDQQSQLQDAGYAMRSMVYDAPVFGGSSWLANASILCRLKVKTEKDYFALMEAGGSCVPKQFNEAGYHSVFAASNTTYIDDEYRRKFPFETFITKDDFGYKGPRMSWSYMPDQFLIDVVDRTVLSKESDRPFFAYYKLTSSHHPWDTIPAFIEDWSEIGDGASYHERESLRFPDNAFIGGKHYNEGYEAAVRYSMRTIVDYLEKMPAERDVLAIVLGDHQPRRPVAIMDRDPWTVPYHVISRDKELIDRFARIGYTPGLFTPAPTEPAPGLETVASHIIRGLNDMVEIEPAQ